MTPTHVWSIQADLVAHHQLFEWESRRFDGDNAVPVADAERLVRVARKQEARLAGKGRTFDFQRDALVARNLVGLVSAGDTSCEILPKVDRGAVGDASLLRHQLVHILGAVHDLPVADDAPIATGMQNSTLLEFLIGRFTDMLEAEIRRGIPRAYISHRDDLPAVRGRLDATRQFTTLAAGPHKLACQYDEFSADIALNHAMKAAVARLLKVTRLLRTRRRLGELALVYADVSDMPPRQIAWTTIAAGRGTSSWLPLVRFAKLLLGEQFQNSSHGSGDGFSLLFDMNVLFERYIERLFRPIASSLDLQLRAQGDGRPCLVPEDHGEGLFATYPDIRLMRGGDTVCIVDTKWKCLTDHGSDVKMGVKQADVYQMMAYAQLYRCPHVILLYPFHNGLKSPAPRHHRMAVAGTDVRITIATVDMDSHACASASLSAIIG